MDNNEIRQATTYRLDVTWDKRLNRLGYQASITHTEQMRRYDTRIECIQRKMGKRLNQLDIC